MKIAGDISGQPIRQAGAWRRKLALALGVTALALLAFAAHAGAAKVVTAYFGSQSDSGSEGGELSAPQGLAVNVEGAGGASPGDVYVADSQNRRISQFDAEGNFVRAFGRDVIVNEGSPANDNGTGYEICDVTAGNIAADCKAGIASSFSGIDGAGAIDKPHGIALDQPSGDLVVLNPGLNRVDRFTATGEFKWAAGRDVVASGPGDSAANEERTITVRATAGTYRLRFGPNEPSSFTGPIAFDAPAATIEAELNALPAIGGAGGSVSVGGGPGDETGSTPYTVVFEGTLEGDDITTGLHPNQVELSGGSPSSEVSVATTVEGGGTELCVAADGDVCKSGVEGWQGGEFHFSSEGSAGQVAIAPAGAPNVGNVYISDASRGAGRVPNNRVQELTAAGEFVRAWGWNTVLSGPGQHPEEENEVQVLTPTGATTPSGDVAASISGDPTTGLGMTVTGVGWAPDATAGEVEQAIAAAAGHTQAPIGIGNVSVTGPAGGPWTVEFTGRLAGRDMEEIFDELGTITVETTTEGRSGFEICEDAAGDVCQMGERRSGLGGFGGTSVFPAPASLATDAGGRLYALDGNRVQRFDHDGQNPQLFASAELDPAQAGGGPATHLGFDLTSETLLAAKPPSEGGGQEVKELDLSGALLDTHMQGAEIASVNGLAVNPASGRIYASSERYGSPPTEAHRVYVLEDGAFAGASATISAPTNVTTEAATFHGTVNPNGFPPASYRFEYSEDGGEWTALGEDAPMGEGTEDIEVEATAEGLKPATAYRVRLVVTKHFGGAGTTTEELLFTTESALPDVTTLPTSQRSATSATIYGRIDPNGLPSTYRFEWGESEAYGQAIPVPDGDAGSGTDPVLVSAKLEGLEPGKTYHYRLVATNSDGTGAGADRSFTTRETAAAAPGRAYEMVTPPFKVTRSVAEINAPPRDNPRPGYPSLDGDSITWQTSFLPLSDDVADPGAGDKRIIRRTPSGWVNETRNTLAPFSKSEKINPAQFLRQRVVASSGDFETVTWDLAAGNTIPDEIATLLPTEGEVPNRLYTRRDGTGTAGFTPWLSNPEEQGTAVGFSLADVALLLGGRVTDSALFNDAGSAMARWGRYRGLEGVTDPSDDQQLPGRPGGATVYAQRAASADALPGAPKDLVSECTGSGAEATLVPARLGSGEAASDTIGARACEAGEATSRRGAVAGGRAPNGPANPSSVDPSGPAASALSDDGRRVFFTSPDPGAEDGPKVACLPGAGPETDCPAQLFVRQYGSLDPDDGTVRWLSASRSEAVAGEPGAYEGAMIASQQIGLLGAGAHFQRASRDGRFVYFKTNAPLTPDDPNGAKDEEGDTVAPPPGGVTSGTASDASWDLYRYELPPHPADPGDGKLMRISGGPEGMADPATNVPSGDGGVLRYLSDDGRRAYFLTTAPIAGADATPAKGAVTEPGGAPGNTATRNLYLFDDNESGAARWRFITRIPYETITVSDSVNACASHNAELDVYLTLGGGFGSGNCFRGTPDGGAVLFTTLGQLSGDDDDGASDVYLYDAEADELVRVSAPPQGAAPYGCANERVLGEVVGVAVHCNGELQRGGSQSVWSADAGAWEGMRGWGGARYFNLARGDDGELSVFFATQVPLVPEDTNGDYMDVYEWRAGELSLISPGTTEHDSWFSGNSLDGRDVFFVTGSPIDPRELDPEDLDIYDARIGGGFPYTPPPVPCDVLALQCESAAIAAPSLPLPATLAAGPAGNVAPRARRGARRCAKLARNAKRTSRNAKRFRRAARRASGPRAAKLAKRARRAARNARRTSKGAKRCRRRARRADARRRASR